MEVLVLFLGGWVLVGVFDSGVGNVGVKGWWERGFGAAMKYLQGWQSFAGGWRSGLGHRLSARGCAGGLWEGCGSGRVSGWVQGLWTFG